MGLSLANLRKDVVVNLLVVFSTPIPFFAAAARRPSLHHALFFPSDETRSGYLSHSFQLIRGPCLPHSLHTFLRLQR